MKVAPETTSSAPGEPELELKILVVGPVGGGRTAMVEALVHGSFSGKTRPTVSPPSFLLFCL